MKTLSQLYDRINRASPLDFGIIFSQSIDLFKKSWLQGFILQLFIFALALPFLIIFYIPFIGLIISESQNGYVDSHVYEEFLAGFSILYISFFLIGIMVMSSVSLCLYAAFYRILFKFDHDQEVVTNDFFIFLKGKYLSKAFILVLITALVYGVVTLLVVPTFFVSILGIFYLIVPFTFLAPVMGFNPDLSVGDIVSTSFKLGNKKWFLAFGLIMVSALLASTVGFLLCGIGSLFTAAFNYHPVYFIYKDVIGFDDENDSIESIGEVDMNG
ncbi:MAG: hypothetical protein HKN00_10555 [Flavobacteriaceae bacterium]|nr:hypothetical protein [Bacteroidia bacterium]MBT8288476.1 hypothetical protein [Bacteroidia bacterium]NNF75617.1 hypothetical protein [Flavobacteriaceae bacterium]NNK74217.1 hypothetical protein [Flavobacteriaceae bacterium]